jgi:hypothetical protein
MKIVKIKNIASQEVTHEAKFPTIEDANSWINLIESSDNNPFAVNGPYEVVIEDEDIQEITNYNSRKFLESTDWLVLRHIGQKALNLETSLSDQEYLDLEIQRQSKRDEIV